jgi:hypothetical protein
VLDHAFRETWRNMASGQGDRSAVDVAEVVRDYLRRVLDHDLAVRSSTPGTSIHWIAVGPNETHAALSLKRAASASNAYSPLAGRDV